VDITLCGANATNMKYYFNEERFKILPEQIKTELKTILVKYCSDVGGAITFSFNETYDLIITTYEPIDEIGAELKVGNMRREHKELFEQLELFARTFIAK